MQVLVPHLSCVVTEANLQQAVDAGYGEIYIITPKGPYKRVRLTHGRSIQLKVDSIPGVADTIREEINFLPAGKVPYRLLNDIVDFFRAVMTVKKADQEAMAHILWNPQDGYHIGIPTQSVSKASVRYDFDDVKPGDVIVVDIHSHNTMGAFFSGTDNNDDRRSICYSGVAGHLDKPEPSFVWRFNNQDLKRECKLSDIFDVEVVTPSVNSEWLDKVTVGYTWSKGGPNSPKNLAPWTPPIWAQGELRGPGFYAGGQGLSSKPSQSGKGEAKGERESKSFGSESIFDINTDPSLWEEYEAASASMANSSPLDKPKGSVPTGSSEFQKILGGYSRAELLAANEEDEAMGIRVDMQTGAVTRTAASSDLALDRDDPEDDPPVGMSPGEADYFIAEFGPKAAEAFEQIEIYLEDLEGADELLMMVLRACYEMLSNSGQAKLQTTGL